MRQLGIQGCGRLRHLRLKWMYCDEDASDAICALLSSLRTLRSLRKVTLQIDVLELSEEETLAELEEDRDLLLPIEQALLQLPTVKKVVVEFINLHLPTKVFDWYPAFIRAQGPRFLPILHEKGMLVLK